MADNINTTSIASFIPQVWANEALEILRSNIVLAPLVTKDTDVAAFNVGDTLHIPYAGTLVAHDKAQNQPVTKQSPNSKDTTVKLDHHKEVTIMVEDFAKALAQPFLTQEYVKAQIIALAEQVDAPLFARQARQQLEAQTGQPVVTGANYLPPQAPTAMPELPAPKAKSVRTPRKKP